MNLNNDILKDMICTDYDSMGNHGRFPMPKKRKFQKSRNFSKSSKTN